jgi:hypothetical protein
MLNFIKLFIVICLLRTFYDISNDCLDRFMSVRCCQPYAKSRSFYYPLSVRRKLYIKSQAWRVHRAFHTPESPVAFWKAASDCKNAIYSFVVNYENNGVTLALFHRYATRKYVY